MDFVTWSLLLGSFGLFAVYLMNCYNYWKKRGIPSPDGVVPTCGHMLPVITLRKTYAGISYDVYKKFKDRSMVGLYNMRSPVLLVRDPDLVKAVLQTSFTNFHQNGFKIDPEMDPLLAKNPFFTYGEEWSNARKRLTYAFSSMRLKILFVTVNRVCEKFQNYLDKKLQKSSAYEVELKDLCSRYTGEVVANAGFGLEGFCFEDQQHPSSFQKIGKELFEPSLKIGLVQVLVFFLPWLGKLMRVSFIPRRIHNFFMNVIRDILRSRRTETIQRNDFFQLMMELGKQEGQEIDELTLTSHALSFFVDGYETSSIVLSFIGYHLAMHRDVQQKLREEICSVFEKHDGALTYEGLKEMTYMDQVINESQRFFPAVGVLQKVCTKEYDLQGSDGLTVRVEPGTEVLVPVYGLHRDPAYWTDPETFDPERFGEEQKKGIKKFAYLPFGEGPRICVGMRMALVQVKACVAVLLKNYKLALSPKTQLPLKLSGQHFLTTPIGGLWVNIEKL